MKLPTLLNPNALREIFATPRRLEAPHRRNALKAALSLMAGAIGNVVRDELTGTALGCSVCGKASGEMIVIHRGRRRWTDKTGRHSEKVTERRHPGCKPTAGKAVTS